MVDRVQHEDLIRFHGAECEVLQGFYFDEGRNGRMGEVAEYVFERRAILKKQGNPLQEVMKLVMNSAYGKNGQKPVECNVRYIASDKIDRFIANNFDKIASMTPVNDSLTRVEVYVEVDNSFNRQHVSCEVLSMAKRIVNEVAEIFDEVGHPVHMTDTDSLHVRSDAISDVERIYKERYDRDLQGDALGQFHCDFEKLGSDFECDFDSGECQLRKGSTPKAVESIFLAKKVYCDRIKDDRGREGLHFRMKRVPRRVLLDHAERDFGGDVMELYRHLLIGERYRFDLKAGGSTVFRTHRDHSVHTLETSWLEVQFL